ncbi:hypothetical protein E3Q19_01323 [Wallemia mellicola]|nr:hypothetical protein E3Q19_01323 [Wallemia mellicola]
MSTHNIPPSTLSPHSYPSSLVRLCMLEKIYESKDLKLIQVDLNMGDNFHPSFLSINPAGTVPLLLVPNAESIQPDRAPEFTRIADTKNICNFLATKRRSVPSLIPLPHLVKKSNEIIDYLHSGDLDTNFLMLSATNNNELELNSSRAESYLISRQTAFDRYRHLCSLDRKNWFELKSQSNLDILNIYRFRSLNDDQILSNRQDFFKASQKTWSNLKNFLRKVDIELSSNDSGPWIFGQDLTLVDLHLAAFLARVIADINGNMNDEGIYKLYHICNLHLSKSMLLFWRNWLNRQSFRCVYMERSSNNS